jgi:hypothetical protein
MTTTMLIATWTFPIILMMVPGPYLQWSMANGFKLGIPISWASLQDLRGRTSMQSAIHLLPLNVLRLLRDWVKQAIVERLRKMGKRNYPKYLEQPECQEIYEAGKKARNYCCEECGKDCSDCPWELETHHLNYDHLGEERPEDLEYICDDCHQRFHGK